MPIGGGTPTRPNAQNRAVAIGFTVPREGEPLVTTRVSRRALHGQRGGGYLSTFVWLAVLAACVYVGIKVVPVMVTEYQFQDFLDTTARFASVNRNQSAADVSKLIMEEAMRQEIPLMPEDVHVTAQAGLIDIKADYSVTVDLNVYQLTLNFHPNAENKPLT